MIRRLVHGSAVRAVRRTGLGLLTGAALGWLTGLLRAPKADGKEVSP